MAYINQPPELKTMFQDIYNRLNKLETAQRFTAPDVTSQPTYPRIGDIIYNATKSMLEYWNGIEWVEIADDNVGTTILTVYPTLKTVNNNIVYTGNPVRMDYQRIGKMITTTVTITCTNITNFGTGQWYFELPVGFPTFQGNVVAFGSLIKAGVLYTIMGQLAQGDNKMYLDHPTANGSTDIVSYNKPTTITTSTILTVNGTAIIT